MSELPKTFDPAEIEARWYAHWESNGLFRPDRPGAEPWTIVNPPPNVTGSLHIGHALDNTLQDILVRHARLKGKDARWVVGMDHAGIATQMVVERQLAERQDKRTNYSREEFVDLVWKWKAESGGAITGQLRRLGCSMDWSDERFTMDEGFSKAVLKVFVELHKQGLLYRDKRLVNWDPALKTAISDLEVESRPVQGHMWHFKYPLAGGETYTYVERDADGNVVLEEERDYISIATTRPETMLGDGAVAVHPDDERYRPIVGKLCEIPVGPKALRRQIPIITDDYPDPHFGSGAVKITGAHDENDYGVAQRNGIPMYRLMDDTAAMRSDGAPYAEAAARAQEIARGATATAAEIDTLNLVPEAYRGLDRYEARKRVVADIDADGLMIKVEDKLIMQPFGDRGGVVIEPMLTDQWYVDAATLAKPAIEAVRSGATKVVPKSWEKTYFNWMENIQPWCVSRQLWWGHRIPAWYAEDGRIFVAETEEEARAQAGQGVTLKRDEDVLDTWFSSALWPFATMGWPDETDPTLGGRYPNDVLISGFDILFFWDARMMMQGLHFMKEVPFKTLYLHGLVRAADGQKMSKSKGNVVDPLGLIDQYGADALRFFMAAMESQGRDVKMDEKRVEGYRNFATKLWNAARFAQSNGISASEHIEPPAATLAVNKWIVAETVATVQAMDLAFADYRFDEAANAIYQFVWSRFCDWYLELIKPVLQTEGAEGAEETRLVAGWVLDQILVLLHAFMPFITEELWSKLGDRPEYPLITAKWPMADARALDPEAAQEIDWLIRLISEIRSARTELNVPPGAQVVLLHREASGETQNRINRQYQSLIRLARIAEVREVGGWQGAAAQIVVDEATYVIPLEGLIDVSAERARLTKAIAAAEKERDSLNARLSNPAFTEKAKPEAVEKARADHAEKSAEAARLQAALGRLG
ncbi:valine--tRNA ligase [Sphingomonas sp. BT-65]|uniref:valine--tRNA ligase n=1 Tax=Sphingomonas sp. BT-65 TaxID=2989821 RepID=UPI002235D9C4|nr:valine--tRNA ligase [Sphingomonas sp. BT-65]MCW4461055.1 valine--tRNA ligase [Sphingomonas sp. BT-65]